MRLLLVTLLACLALTHAITYNELQGVWSTNGVDSAIDCRFDFQFQWREFTEFNTGPSCTTVGPWFGTYAIDGDDLWIQWAYTAVNNNNNGTAERMGAYYNGTELFLTLHPGTDDAHTLTLFKNNGSNFDGVWTGVSSLLGSTTQRLYLASDILELYANAGTEGMGAVFGILNPLNGDNGLNDATSVNLTYAYAPSILTALLSNPAPLGWNASVPNQLIITMNEPIAQTLTFNQKISSSSLDGSWAGNNNNCYNTFEILTGVFKYFATGCLNATNTAVAGPIDILNSTHLALTFAFASDNFQYSGLTKIFAYNMSSNQLFLSNWISGSPFVLNKITAPPAATTATVTLAADLSSFNDAAEQSFLTALSQQLGLSRSNIIILSKSAGSVVLNMLMLDDQVQGKTATAAATTLSTLSNVGGYQVQSVAISSSGGTIIHTSTGETVYVPGSSTGAAGGGTTTGTVTSTGTYSGMSGAPVSASAAGAFASVAALLIAALLL